MKKFVLLPLPQVGAVTLSAAGMILLEMGAEGLAMA